MTESLARIEDFAGKWMKSAKSADKVIDLVLMEKHLMLLPENVQFFGKKRKPKSTSKVTVSSEGTFMRSSSQKMHTSARTAERRRKIAKY